MSYPLTKPTAINRALKAALLALRGKRLSIKKADPIKPEIKPPGDGL